MVELCALASGSNGNCYYIGNETSAILIDIGITYNKLVERFEQANLQISKVNAVFISHEHFDHVRGMKIFNKRNFIQGYFTKKTFSKVYKKYKPETFSFFKIGTPLIINKISVIPFTKKHNAIEPSSFVVKIDNKTVVILTDVGIISEEIGVNITKSDAIFIESNYDEKMLWEGRYPYYLKERNASDFGHLSNDQAKNAIDKYGTDKLKAIFLSHISERNNSPEIIKKTFKDLFVSKEIEITSRYNASKVIKLP